MANVPVYDMNGKKVSETELNDAVFGITPNEAVMHAMVVNYLANQRQGTQSTLTRTEVSGGGRKPYRQKGTGHARQGSIRAPQWYHGGVALGPKPRSYRYSLNKKVRRLAMLSAFSQKVLDQNLVVIDNLAVEGFKTKTIVNMLKGLEISGKALIVTQEADKQVYKSAANIQGVKASAVNTLNVYDILNYDKFIVSKGAVAKIEVLTLIFVPIAIGVAQKNGYPIMSLAFPVAMLVGHVYVLPFNSKPAALLYTTNQYSWSDTFKFGITMMFISWLMIILWGETVLKWFGYTNGVF